MLSIALSKRGEKKKSNSPRCRAYMVSSDRQNGFTLVFSTSSLQSVCPNPVKKKRNDRSQRASIPLVHDEAGA